MFFFRTHTGIFERIQLDVSGRLYVSPMPYGPYDTGNVLLRTYRKYRIEFAVMLVTDDELKRKAKRNLLAHYEKQKISIIRFPIADYTSPDPAEFLRVVDQVSNHLRTGARIAIHCNAGVGRTGVMACCIVRNIMGTSGDEAITYVRQFMKTHMTDEQKRLINHFQPLTSRSSNAKQLATRPVTS